MLKGNAYNASKKEYFYGCKVHLFTAADGRIVEFEFSLGLLMTEWLLACWALTYEQAVKVFADKIYTAIWLKNKLNRRLKQTFSISAKPTHIKQTRAVCPTAYDKGKGGILKPTLACLKTYFPERFMLSLLMVFFSN